MCKSLDFGPLCDVFKCVRFGFCEVVSLEVVYVSVAPQYRAPWCALVSVVWTAILSTMRGSRESDE